MSYFWVALSQHHVLLDLSMTNCTLLLPSLFMDTILILTAWRFIYSSYGIWQYSFLYYVDIHHWIIYHRLNNGTTPRQGVKIWHHRDTVYCIAVPLVGCPPTASVCQRLKFQQLLILAKILYSSNVFTVLSNEGLYLTVFKKVSGCY